MRAHEFIIEGDDRREMLTEWAWLLPAIAAAVRLGAPLVTKLLSKEVAKKAATEIAKKSVGGGMMAGKVILKNPGKALTAYGAYELYQTIDDAIEHITQLVGDALDPASIKALAAIALQYALPVGAVIAILYGGKKLYDYISSEKADDTTTTGGMQSGIMPAQ